MVSPSAQPREEVPLTSAALEFAVQRHARQRRNDCDASFIEHPLEVARLLRDAGCSETLIAAGLLHDVLESCDVGVYELTFHFGAEIADLVQAVTDATALESYAERKQQLRDQVRRAGGETALLFAADTISALRSWPRQVMRDRARVAETAQESSARSRLGHYHEVRLEHYRASLEMLRSVAPQHPLVERVAQALEDCSAAIARCAHA